MTLMVAVAALALGIAMGLLGGGGSIIAVPLLTFAMGFSPKDAVAASLVIVALAALGGVAGALIRGVLPLRLAGIVAAAAMAGGLAGGTIGARLPDDVQLVLLALMMFGAAILMWRAPVSVDHAGDAASSSRLIAIGLTTGCVTGLVGVGGGFLIVPALVLGARLPMRRAAAASLFVIAAASLSALSRYDVSLPWRFVTSFGALAAAGAVAGGVASCRLPQRILQQCFAVALVILGSYVLTKA